MFESYVNWFYGKFGTLVTSLKEIERLFCNSIYIFLKSAPAQHQKMCFFINLLSAIGVSSELIPLNLYQIPPPKVRKVMEDKQAKKIFDLLRSKIWFLQKQFRMARSTLDHELVSAPVLGKVDAYDENTLRAIAVRQLHQQVLKNGNPEQLRRYFQDRLGCPYLDDDEVERRDPGYVAHLRWLFPTPDDLCAIFALISMRGPWNFSSIGAIQGRNKWFREFPFKLQLKSGMEFCYIIAQKIRGRRTPLDKVKTVRVVSAMRPWSHPYKLLAFVEEWAGGLRDLIDLRLGVLSSIKSLSSAETDEYNYLTSIKDDLFLYFADGEIRSLTHYADIGEPPKWMRAAYKRWGIPGTRGTRDYSLTGAYQLYAHDIMSIYYLASHNSPGTSRQYSRRRASLSETYQRFINVFSSSVRLIRAGEYSTKRLRKELEAQGFDDEQLGSLLDHELRTRWGNGCATPKNPPAGYGTRGKNGYCESQNCLDGCTSARWFPDSGPVVKARLDYLKHRRTLLGLVSRLGSSIDYDIQKLELILDVIYQTKGDQ